MKQSILVRSLSASAFLCAVALLPAGCASTPAKSAGGSPTAGASTAPAAAPAKKKTVDGLAKDQSRKSFDTQPVVLAAGKPLPRSTRPAAMPLLDATLAPESPKQVAAAPEVVVSHPAREEDRELVGSSLIAGVPAAAAAAADDERYPR